MTIAQHTTIQTYQLRKGGTPARMSILRMIAADSANNANTHTRLEAGDWRGARHWTLADYESAYGHGMSQGLNGKTAVWCAFSGSAVRNERDAHDIARIGHRGWFTDNEYQEDMSIGIVGTLTHGRFIAGYRLTMNDERVYFDEVFTDEEDAARMADEHARVIAEQECEYADEQRAELNESEDEGIEA